MAEHERLSALAKERWLLDESSPEERARVEQQLSASQRAELRADDRALRAQLQHELPAHELVQRVKARAARGQEPKAKPQRMLLASMALGACLALLYVVRPSGYVEPQPQQLEERAKGLLPALHVYRRRGEKAERLQAGALLRAHDVVQLGYVAAGHQYGVLFSIDGSGQVTLHFPSDEQGNTSLGQGSGERLLEAAYELDSAPHFERFFFVVGDQALDVRQLLATARALSANRERAQSEMLPLRPDVKQYSVLLRKEQP